MGRHLRSVALFGAIFVVAGACSSGEDDDASSPPIGPASAQPARPRAVDAGPAARPTEPAAIVDAPPPSSADLDRVVAGRSVREWIAVIAADDRNAPQALADARAALAGDRESAVRALLAMLAADPGEGWTRIRVLAQDLREDLVPGLLALRGHADPLVQTTVENELRRMARTGGFGAHDAAVVQAFLEGGLDRQEIDLLRGMGAAARPAVEEILRQIRERRGEPADPATLDALASFGETAAGAADLIVESLDSREGQSDNEWAVFAALQHIPLGDSPGAPPSERVLGALRRALNGDSSNRMVSATRVLVAHGLGEMAHVAVLRALASSDPEVLRDGLEVVQEFRSPPPGAVDAVLRIAMSGTDWDAWTAAQILGRWSTRDDAALLALLSFNGDERDRVRFEIAILSQPDAATSPPLMSAFRSKDPAIRRAALEFASAGVPFYIRSTVLRWARALSDDADPAVAAAARALAAAMDADDIDAGRATVTTSGVVDRLLNGTAAERAAAVASIRAADADPVEVVQSLVAIVDGTAKAEGWVVASALYALKAIGPRAAASLPAIASILRNPEAAPYLFDAAALAAGAIGGDGLALLAEQVRRRGETQGLIDGIAVLPESSVPAMLEALNDRDADVRAAFLRGLRWHGAEAETLVGRARALLADRSGAVRLAAAGTILYHRPGDPDALRALGDILRGEIAPGDDVLDAAVWEVANLGSRATVLLPEIERVLRNPVSCPTWSLAASAAGNCGEAGGPAAAALAAALDGRLTCTADGCRHYESRTVAAAIALRRLGRAALPVRPSIERATRSADDRTATVARAILAAFEEKQALAGTK